MAVNTSKALSISIFRDYNTTLWVDDLTGRWSNLQFSTQLHGGFGTCSISVPMSLPNAWEWLNRLSEGVSGRHFHYFRIQDGTGTVWEGRIADITLRSDNTFLGIDLFSMGYWSAMRDQLYLAGSGTATDWTVGSHNTGKIIRELITQRCPDVNGTVDVTLTPDGIGGINLGTAWAYPMDIIVDKLAPLAGTGADRYYFSVYESRKPYWTARTITQIDWMVSMADFGNLRLMQSGKDVRNYVLPVIGGTAGTSTLDTESTAIYPRRDIILSLQAGVPTAAANNARDAMLTERKQPAQEDSFILQGHAYSTKAGNLSQSAGTALEEKPKWWIRAGDVLRIKDLVPHSAATGTFDRLRTFYLMETVYNANNDSLQIQPDRPSSRLANIMARIGTMELQR